MVGNASLKRPSSGRDRSLSPPPVRRKIQSTTTRGAVAGFFTPASKKEPEKITWLVVKGTLLVARSALQSEKETEARSPRLIAAFDLDSTLITTKQGGRFPKDAADWKWWHPVVPGTLTRLHHEGYQIVILSNQGGISLQHDPKTVKGEMKRLKMFKEKVSSMLQQLDLPVTVYAATAQDAYRKPRTRMWLEMLDDHDLDPNQLELGSSFLVGDAAGRLAEDGHVKDHSCSDRNFAANVGIQFHTPEEYFLKEAARSFVREFDPKIYLETCKDFTGSKRSIVFPSTTLEVAMFCGSPGAGKSSFYWQHLAPFGYQRINQDLLKTRDRCLDLASKHLSEGQRVAIDNTNADTEVRARWIQLARAHDVPIRCFHFTAPSLLCQHNNVVRALNGTLMNPESRKILPDAAFRGFASRYQAPKIDEGFQEVVAGDFEFQGTDEQREVWSRYWI